jgi:NADH-quinone oxidoreductase subunit L
VPGTFNEIHIALSTEAMIAAISTLIAVAGWFLARNLYKEKQLASDVAFEQRAPGLARALENKWYVDELYAKIVVDPLAAISRFFWKGIDAVIDGIAALLGFIVRGFGDVLRFFQTGNVRNYALMFFIGVIVFIAFFG